MQRYFICFSYDGTNYHGWQIQPNGNSVQEELQHVLSLLLREEVLIVGAGRTDAGVHARMMVAHFDTEKDVAGENLTYKLNRVLPKDISINSVVPVNSDMHARFSATSRTYHYYINQSKNPFKRFYSCELHYDLDFALMNKVAAELCQVDDFAAFCKTHTDVKTTLCKVTEAVWIDDGDGCWHFRITANRFLRNMVRAIVGTLIDVGRHKISIEEFRKIVEGKKRTDAGESMPAHALFLEDIQY
jgi:tRNA pseudouridine38-40 synthase